MQSEDQDQNGGTERASLVHVVESILDGAVDVNDSPQNTVRVQDGDHNLAVGRAVTCRHQK